MTKAKNEAAASQDTGEQPTADTQHLNELEALNETLAQREKDLKDLSDENETLKSENESLKAVIGELNAALAEKDSEIEKNGGRPIIKDGKDSYELRLKKFVHRIDGKAVEVDEAYLKAHPEVVKDLIKKKSGALVKKGGK